MVNMLMSKPLALYACRALNTVAFSLKHRLHFQQQIQSSSSLYLSAVAQIRTRSSNDNGSSKNDEAEKTEESDEEHSTRKSPFNDPALMRRMRIYMLVVGGCTFVLSYFALAPLFSKRLSTIGADLETKPLEMDEFLKVFIPSGEVKRIVHYPNQGRAVAWLHDGAIINGKPLNHSLVVIRYDRSDGRPVEHFRDEIRAVEKKLGIPLRNGVEIENFYGFTSFK
ncbi:Uncharacterized protein Tcan_04791 [Toxocara canis]|uniref:Uncharacterized protein n=1 Tax=Toxocara canis TaxID=6265 RepID=A0A0B2VZN1_TOXCA|nr:Uncharacterized protein Tcan_04791 [Toxocara canis]